MKTEQKRSTYRGRGMLFRVGRGVGALLLSGVLAMYLPISAYAADPFDLSQGPIIVNTDTNGNHTVNGVAQTEEIIITSGGVETTNFLEIVSAGTGENAAKVTLQDVIIYRDESSREAAITTSGSGDVVIELNGTNTISSGDNSAGLEKHNDGNLTIQDEIPTGNTAACLTATGGENGAGIGGEGNQASGSNITISGGNVTAIGGISGAGIGGGYRGAGSDITITGGNVTAIGGEGAAGIGGGCDGAGSVITITGGNVTATGGINGAGIGSGAGRNAGSISLTGGEIIAIGGASGAGIGGGCIGTAQNITISGSANVYVAGGGENRQYDYGYVRGAGAAIGNGSDDQNNDPSGEAAPGTPVEPNTTGHTGILKTFDAGTSVDEIKAYIENPPVDPDDPDNHDDPVKPVNPDDKPSDQKDPTAPVIIIADDVVYIWEDSYSDSSDGDQDTSGNSNSESSFINVTETAIDDLLRQLYSLLNSGNIDAANALIKKGITINAGTNRCFTASTLVKIAELSKAGIPITVNFINEGTAYSVIIPGGSNVAPDKLVNSEGCCGFLNLMSVYGGTKLTK